MPGRLQDANYAAFIDHLISIRRTSNLTQSELAARLQKPQSYVSKFERLERRLDVAEWREIVRALDDNAASAFGTVDGLLEDQQLLSNPPP